MRVLLAGVVAALALAAPSAWADVAVTGAVTKPLALTPAALAAEPLVSLHVAFATSHGDEAADYAGVPLWTVLQRAGLVDGQAKGAHLRHGILVTGADGYGVLLAIGELDPEFAGKQVILAVKRDGQPLAGDEGVRLVVPGDKRGGRSVRHVVKIEVE
ncbi:molybdopterin-binding oxidoreductase [Aliidongia dinghuensis]|uniref:Molybdopterin-binding oxidoreductase n=1 Tax=Aliidongia dinghuensis TaxID=1867774 RepID=A0A8J2Z1Z4_9PROT|nr:molybdopterin-dependent oxidoreductase [Aliidongia dinghuensis]GGF48282.1 molybdopterin-binding oxidoreductase [Aliidongia dinghuensis]